MDEEPLSTVASLDAATVAVVEQPDVDEAERRAALARIRRLRGRAVERGVSVFEFAAMPARALRVYYSSADQRADPAGDLELVRYLLSPFDTTPADVPRLSELLTRPHYTLKASGLTDVGWPDDATAFYMMREQKYSTRRGREVEDPFQEGDTDLVLFDDLTRRPVYRAAVVGVERARDYDAASGVLALAISPLLAADAPPVQ